MLGLKKKASTIQSSRFELGYEDGAHILTLVSANGRHAVSEWDTLRPAARAALGEAFAAAEEERRTTHGDLLVAMAADRLKLHPAFVAGLDSAAAVALDIPAPTGLALDVRSDGRISDEAFRVETRWVRPGGQRVRADLQGAILINSGRRHRVPEPLWSLHKAAARLATPALAAERYAALAELRAAWPEDARAPVESDGYLRDLRVHHAAQFSLKLGRLGAFDFDPVLFGPKSSSAADDERRELDEEADNVLGPGAQRLFAEDRFRRESGVRPVYVLRDGEYVFIDPSLRPALDVVRQLQDAPEADRRAFVLNPRRGLREKLGDQTSDTIDLDQLFVETEQFSARVAGVDLWRAPVLPWLTPGDDNNWWPKRFGLRVGQEYFVLPAENIDPLLKRIDAAIALGSESVEVQGILGALPPDGVEPPNFLPTTSQVREAVETFRPFAPGSSEDGGDASTFGLESTSPPALRGKLFLVVRENLEEVEFTPLLGPEASNPRIEASAVQPPDRLKATLKPHQIEGFSWLVRSVRKQRHGALLADDMGLGKTLQAIAFMAWLQHEMKAGRRPFAPFLVVAPTGLLGNWRDEIAQHLRSPYLGELVCAFGSDLKRLKDEDAFGARDIESGRASLRAEEWSASGVVLTTYETLRDFHFSFARTRFGIIVFDEIQKLKNPASQLSRAAKTLNAAFVLGMTGTPVENRLQDLWAITDVISPGLLGSSKEFERLHSPNDAAALRALKANLTGGDPPYMLRRLKADVLGAMPKKQPHPSKRTMPERQAAMYRNIVVRAATLAAAGTAGPGAMLTTLAALRSTSLHPNDPSQTPTDLDTYAAQSARLSRTLEILQDIAVKGEKALLFVEDLAMQERLASLIQARFKLATPPMRINGAVPGHKRQALVRAFQEGASGRFDVMILSPKAGGVGLTLTAANHVIHLSRWWNPAVEDQATDRVHRIGQTREVHVHFPMAVHPDPTISETSFDLRLNALIDRKRALTRDLFLPPDASEEDLAELFREVSQSPSATSTSEPLIEDEVRGAPEATAVEGIADSAPSPSVKGRLTLPTVVVGTGARVWRREPGAPRPTQEIVGLFKGKTLSHVCIRDPYALARAGNRRAQLQFLVDLAAEARSIEAVTIEYAPEIDGDMSDARQRTEFNKAFFTAFSQAQPKIQLVRRARKGVNDDFHDRFVEIDVRGAGGATGRHDLSFGRGLEALYDSRKQCTASYAPPVPFG